MQLINFFCSCWWGSKRCNGLSIIDAATVQSSDGMSCVEMSWVGTFRQKNAFWSFYNTPWSWSYVARLFYLRKKLYCRVCFSYSGAKLMSILGFKSKYLAVYCINKNKKYFGGTHVTRGPRFGHVQGRKNKL